MGLLARSDKACSHVLFAGRRHVDVTEHISTAYTMSNHHRISIPNMLGPLLGDFYTMESMRTHHRASIPLRLGPLLRECYSIESTY